ncbi:MAG TPA: hypothetical protein VGF67_18885 [Ktedonobacteraceae bacterium]|jgi:hypothetical protein
MGFQPGIAIFADQTSQAVYSYFLSLIRHMHTPIQHGIGLIHLTDVEQRFYTAQLVSEMNTGVQLDPVSADLSAVLTHLQTRLLSKEEAEYYHTYIALKQPLQLYVIGDTSTQTRELAAELRDFQAAPSKVEISYLFCCKPQPTKEDLFTRSDDLATWAAEQNIRFSYLYGDVTEDQQRAYSQEDVAYAAALALFTLLVTDLSSHLRARQQAEQTSTGAPQVSHCGTLSASLISSPHEHIRQAYAARVGELLLENWQTEVIQARGNRDLQDAAMATMKKTSLSWLRPPLAESQKERAPNQREQASHDTERKELAPLSHLAPEPTTAHLDKETRPGYEALYQAYEKQTANLLRLDLGRRGRMSVRRQAALSQTGNWEAWRQTFVAVWTDFQQQTSTRIKQAIEQLWEKTGLSGVVTYATMLDEQLQHVEKQLLQVMEELKQIPHSEPISPPPSAADQQGAGNAHASAESPEQELARQLNSRPDRLLLSLVMLAMSMLLSLASWMLVSEFGSPPPLLLVPIALLCCGGMFALEYIYLSHTYLVPLTQTLQRVQASAREKWLKRCLAESYTQRLELLRQFRAQLGCLSRTSLKETTGILHKQAREALEQPFAQSSGGRNFLCGKGRSLASAEQAELELLNPDRQVHTLYKNLSREFTDRCKTLFYQRFFQSDEEASLQGVLYYEIRSEIDVWFRAEQENDAPLAEQEQRSRTIYISSADFALNTKPEFFQQVLLRTQMPALWQEQVADQPTIFFCANRGTKNVRENANLPGPPIAIETISAREKGAPFGLTTNWILLAAYSSHQPAATAETDQKR